MSERMTVEASAATNRVEAGLPFVEALARRMAATMPHSIDLGDLVQDGVIGLIDAAHRFDGSRGIKFETFAERRIRGRDDRRAAQGCVAARRAPRAARARGGAREAARLSSGTSRRWPTWPPPSVATRSGWARPSSASTPSSRPRRYSSAEQVDEQQLPAVLMPAEPERPDALYEQGPRCARVRRAMATLPAARAAGDRRSTTTAK
jgi:DNA-directed RNA polymerase specialized sigma24 family protein